MKKIYQEPTIFIIRIRPRVLIVDSERITGDSQHNLRYGGIDNDGDLDPD